MLSIGSRCVSVRFKSKWSCKSTTHFSFPIRLCFSSTSLTSHGSISEAPSYRLSLTLEPLLPNGTGRLSTGSRLPSTVLYPTRIFFKRTVARTTKAMALRKKARSKARKARKKAKVDDAGVLVSKHLSPVLYHPSTSSM